jgi:hypothetical protein
VLKSQQKVLLFDNCEHLLPAIAATVDRLARDLDTVRMALFALCIGIDLDLCS